MIFMMRTTGMGRVLAVTALAAFVCTVAPIPALVADACASVQADLDQAKENFDYADYEAALQLLDGILASGEATGDVLRDTNIYRARCLIELGRESEAQDAFCEALQLDADWRPDGVFYSGDEIAIFDRAHAGCGTVVAEAPSESVPWYKKPVVMIVGGVVVVGGLLAALGGGGDDGSSDPDLADFPDPPTGK